jgi:hypothetical protein
MQSSNPATGSITDVLHGVAIAVKGLRDAAEAAYRFPALFHSIESVATRFAVVRRRGGLVPGLAPAVAGLRQAIEESPALQEPGAEGIRAELLFALDRVRVRA